MPCKTLEGSHKAWGRAVGGPGGGSGGGGATRHPLPRPAKPSKRFRARSHLRTTGGLATPPPPKPTLRASPGAPAVKCDVGSFALSVLGFWFGLSFSKLDRLARFHRFSRTGGLRSYVSFFGTSCRTCRSVQESFAHGALASHDETKDIDKHILQV